MPSSGRIQQVAYDTRLITSGEELVFFALQGPQLSGLEFVSSAYEKGVRYFVVESLKDLCSFAHTEVTVSRARSLHCVDQ